MEFLEAITLCPFFYLNHGDHGRIWMLQFEVRTAPLNLGSNRMDENLKLDMVSDSISVFSCE